ncbi:hypothetical protein Hanom_Chr03g00186471 [Helianthus anomalus]
MLAGHGPVCRRNPDTFCPYFDKNQKRIFQWTRGRVDLDTAPSLEDVLRTFWFLGNLI